MSALAHMTWPEAEICGQAGELLVVPVGSTEQHGPHLPLTTDTDIATAIAERVRRAVPGTVVAPPVAYGASGEHDGFAGTVSIGQEALELLLLELGRSASATFARTVLISAHGGNAEPLARAVRRLRLERREVLAWSPQWRGDAHAGRVETSLMLALHPDRVRLERAAAGNPEPLHVLWPELRTKGVRAVAANGVLGDPAGSSSEEGRRLLHEATGDLLGILARWMSPAAT